MNNKSIKKPKLQILKRIDGKFKWPYYSSCKQKYKSFKKANVHTHIRRHHKKQKAVEVAKKQHMCKCGKRYSHKADLVYHQNRSIIRIHKQKHLKQTSQTMKNGQSSESGLKKKFNGKLFDVIMSDPPHPKTGLNLPYNCMTITEILSTPIELIQDKGFVFLQTTNAMRNQCETYLVGLGYKIVTYVEWFKSDDGKSLIHGLGRYFQHCVEECVVGVKGDMEYLEQRFNLQKVQNGFIELRRTASQKPKQIYEMIEQLCPGGAFIDVYGRWLNRRPGWVLFGWEAKRMRDKNKKDQDQIQNLIS
ncbi:MT-A70 family protein [Oxytricha trifallax]|uniref:mRNA m(6)A methyltransferase n=1 Tax=Oxytricha trifallax TaxID=1172189 RepID=A0A073HXA8_9SPIT|nr:MT-A70 family protein [Oxytricha trifallax]